MSYLYPGRHRHQPGHRVEIDTTGKVSLALGVCLCAGQLIGGAPADAAPAVVTPSLVAANTTLAGTAAIDPATSVATTVEYAPVDDVLPVTNAVATNAESAANVVPVADVAPGSKSVAAVKPRVRIAANTYKLTRGKAVTITAKLVDPRTGAAANGGVAHLQAWRNNHWKTWQIKRVSNGTVKYTATPRKFAGFRVVYRGLGSTYKVAISGNAKVAVNPPGLSGSVAAVIAEVRKHQGKPYVWAAAGPRAFDCSGLVLYVYRKTTGKRLPHKANLQQRYGKAVAKSKAQPGDLLFFRRGSYAYHVGIYAGHGMMYDAPRRGVPVGKHRVSNPNYVVRRLL